MYRGADSGSRTRDKRLETSYVTTTPYPHDVMFSPRSLSSLSESVVQSQIKHEAVVVAELLLAPQPKKRWHIAALAKAPTFWK